MQNEGKCEIGRLLSDMMAESLAPKTDSLPLRAAALRIVIEQAAASWTLWLEPNECLVLEDMQVPPGTPAARIMVTGEAVTALGRGETALALLQKGLISISGDTRVLRWLSSAFSPSANPLHVRINTLAGK